MSKILIYKKKTIVMFTHQIYHKKSKKDLKERLVKLEIEMVKIRKNQIVYLVMCHHKEVIDTIMKLFRQIKFNIKEKLVLIV